MGEKEGIRIGRCIVIYHFITNYPNIKVAGNKCLLSHSFMGLVSRLNDAESSGSVSQATVKVSAKAAFTSRFASERMYLQDHSRDCLADLRTATSKIAHTSVGRPNVLTSQWAERSLPEGSLHRAAHTGRLAFPSEQP